MKPTEAQSAHIERTGRWWESISGSRIAGRLIGWLMVCEPAHQSSQELASVLQSSTGSISTQARVLEQIGFIERVTFPGDRATYFQLRSNLWYALMWSEQERILEMRDLAHAARDIVPTERPDRVTHLDLIADFFASEWPGLMERLAKHLDLETTK